MNTEHEHQAEPTIEERRRAAKAAAQQRWRAKRRAALERQKMTVLAASPLFAPEVPLHPALDRALGPRRDDGIRQYHGVMPHGGNEPVMVWEGQAYVHIGKGTGSVFSSAISPLNARYLADRLYELAGRIDRRNLAK